MLDFFTIIIIIMWVKSESYTRDNEGNLSGQKIIIGNDNLKMI